MRIAASKTFKSPEFLTKLSKGQSSGIEVEVTDLEKNTTTTYHAIRAAARALDIDKRYIEHYIYLKQDKPVLGKYTFKLNLNSDDKSTNLINKKVQKTSMKVEVTNVDTKQITMYSSITAAAKCEKKLSFGDKFVIRLLVQKLLNILSLTKTIPTRSSLPFFKDYLYLSLSFFSFGAGVQFNLNSPYTDPKRLHGIYSQRRIGFTFINLNNIYLMPKGCIRTMSTSSGQEPVKTYLYPDKESNTIIVDNKGQPGVYR